MLVDLINSTSSSSDLNKQIDQIKYVLYCGAVWKICINRQNHNLLTRYSFVCRFVCFSRKCLLSINGSDAKEYCTVEKTSILSILGVLYKRIVYLSLQWFLLQEKTVMETCRHFLPDTKNVPILNCVNSKHIFSV